VLPENSLTNPNKNVLMKAPAAGMEEGDGGERQEVGSAPTPRNEFFEWKI
jgi:hypothetical protein